MEAEAAFVAGAYALAFFGVAAVLVATSFGNRAARIFAMLLVLRGVANVLSYGPRLDPADAALYEGLFGYAVITLAPAALYFAVVFPRPRAPFRSPTVRAAVFLLPTILLLGLYALDHAILWTGLLAAVPSAWLAAYAVAALVFVRDLDHEPSATGRRSLILVALGFAVVPAFDLGATAAALARAPADAALETGEAAVALLAAAATAAAAWALRRRGHAGVAGAIVAATLVGVGYALFAGPTLSDVLALLSRLVLPLLVAYGLLRTRVFGLDLSVRWTVARGTLAGAFVGTFLVAAQLAESFLQTRYDWIAGGLGAGLLLFALAPLQRAAERVAERAVPGAKPVGRMTDAERDAFYVDLVKAAWTDGSLSREERRVLETARERLGIARERAHALEAEAAG